MTKIKIVSNPYDKSLDYYSFNESENTWINIDINNINGKLREYDAERKFLPFFVDDIVHVIIDEYQAGSEKIELIFEGTTEEYNEIRQVCRAEDINNKVDLKMSPHMLEDARDILDHIKEDFETVEPVIKDIVKDDDSMLKDLSKVSYSLKDIIPICIFGNYSAGKSTFINALIGYEILPSGGDPVTAKIYEITRSKYEDRAKIEFSYRDEDFSLLFTPEECKVVKGDKEKDLIVEVLSAVDSMEDVNLYKMVNLAAGIINDFEKRDRTETVIGNVIKMEVPFNDEGELGRSHNNFVIFDTPGSNSKTNSEHSEVVSEARAGFSNGIPVWVSTYDNLDTNDNAALCERVLAIKALDKRFTMIVVNRADQGDLQGTSLPEHTIEEIMEYDSVEQMYASGIFFLSSIMGLGSKLDGNLSDKYYKKTYRQQKDNYNDPEDEYYVSLQNFNIMPKQIKESILEKGKEQDSLVYVNSGLFCIEEEMEKFASDYSAYNKCQMAYAFLDGIIAETTRRISNKTQVREEQKQEYEKKLDATQRDLIITIRNVATDTIKRNERDSRTYMDSYIMSSLKYGETVAELYERDKGLTEQHQVESHYSSYEEQLENARKSRKDALQENSKSLFRRDFFNSVKNLAIDWATDTKEIQQRKENIESLKQEIDKATSDRIMDMIIAEYRNNIVDAHARLLSTSSAYWQNSAVAYRDDLIRFITCNENLSQDQKDEVQKIIMEYQPLQFDDEADKVFIKSKFLRGNLFGIRFGKSEKLDIEKLVSIYNKKIHDNVKTMSDMINQSCFNSFQLWQNNLLDIVEKNITQLHPELRRLTDIIKEESDTIAKLQDNQQLIYRTLDSIKEMMSWKDLD